MSNFEDFVVQAKNAFNFVGQKTGDAVELTRLKVSVSETQGKIDRGFAELGRKVYGAAKDQTDCTEFVKEKSEAVDKLIDELAELNKKISELKREKVCPACDYSNPDSATYCQKCGAKL